MKRFVSILILVCGIFFSILTAVLTGFRKYRFYVFTKKTVEDIYEMMQPEKDTAEENTGAEQEWYVYTDPDGNTVSRKEVYYYLNLPVGEEVKCDVGFKNKPCYMVFIPEYENGYLYPDGTQEAYPEDALFIYMDDETGERWAQLKPASYKNRKPGDEIEISLPNWDSPAVTFSVTAEYENGLVYPDGTQEEAY
jgi:hypothetical protein